MPEKTKERLIFQCLLATSRLIAKEEIRGMTKHSHVSRKRRQIAQRATSVAHTSEHTVEYMNSDQIHRVSLDNEYSENDGQVPRRTFIAS